MSITVNKTNDGFVGRMALAGVTTGTLVALHKTGKINTWAADAFINQMSTAIKSGNTAPLKEGGKVLFECAKWRATSLWKGAKGLGEKVLNAGKDFWAKDGVAKENIIKDKATSLWEGAKGLAKKAIDAGKDFWAKDAAGKKEIGKKLLQNPAVKYVGGITAAFVAIGLIIKAIKNHRAKAKAQPENTLRNSQANKNAKIQTPKAKVKTIVTDNYLKSLSEGLDSNDEGQRQSASKLIFKCLQEDKGKYDDPALNALVNKMLVNKSHYVKSMALLALKSRLAKGDDVTKELLQRISMDKGSYYGRDAQQANMILMQMMADSKVV